MAADKGESEMDDAIENIVSKFRKFDLNDDGVITHDELFGVLSQLDPDFWSTSNVVRLMNEMDLNNDGQVEYDEFVRWTFKNQQKPQKQDRKKQKKTKKPAVERVFDKIKPGQRQEDSLKKVDAVIAAFRPEDIEDIVGNRGKKGRGIEPEGSAAMLDALIELKQIKLPGNRRLSVFRGPGARQQLVANPEAFITGLQKMRSAAVNGEVPISNVDRARQRLDQEPEIAGDISEADLARTSEVPAVALLAVFVDSFMTFVEETKIREADEVPGGSLPTISTEPASPSRPPTSPSRPPATPSRRQRNERQEEGLGVLPKISGGLENSQSHATLPMISGGPPGTPSHHMGRPPGTPSLGMGNSTTKRPMSQQRSAPGNLPTLRGADRPR